ncbi:MAG: hypothetical protein IKU72_02520 [Oscillospiraceae bacterium]|nr:hypothetical protein [Oscillospiraceae bacterium]
MDAQVKKVQMPMGIRKKMMAAISMLLVASIMLVSSSYAWFTLSTAPEITGITTSVGANGNLEVALLPADGNVEKITSSTGDSMAVQTADKANVTWGNLVDLSDSAFYGMDKITLYPSALNAFSGSVGTNPLSIPEYGADGRVAELVTTTATAGYNAEKDSFTVDDTSPIYGVRAVGTSSNISARQLTFKSAKGTYNAKISGLATPTKNGINKNITEFLTLAMAGGAPSEFSYKQMQALVNMGNGIQTSLKNAVNAYANAGIAIAAAKDAATVSDDAIAMLSAAISGETSAANLKTTLNTVGVHDFDSVLGDLADEQDSVDDALSEAAALMAGKGEGNTFDTDVVQEKIAKPLMGTSGDIKAYNAAGNQDGVELSKIDTFKTIHLGGGGIGAVAKYAGVFKITTQLEKDLYGGAKGTTSAFTAVTEQVNGLTAPGGEGETNLTDFYGYIIDFAFRTNAADSYLQLQSDAANRVYSDATGENLATMGSGSTGVFTYTENSGVTAEMGKKLMEAMRVAFFDTDTGVLLKVAKFADPVADSTSATGKLTLFDQTVTNLVKVLLGKDAYEATATTTYALVDTTKYTKDNCTNYPVDGEGNLRALTETEYKNLEKAKTESVATGDSWTHTLGKDAFKGTTAHAIKQSITIGGNTFDIVEDGCWNYAATVTPAEYALLAETSSNKTEYTATLNPAADAKLTSLVQNTAKKISVLVYMDGATIDNSAVGNALSSGTLDLNLQFSSSATLVPMQNNTLKNMEKTAAAAAAVEEP